MDVTGGRVIGQGCVLTVLLSASMAAGPPATLMEEERSRTNVEQDGVASTEADAMEAMMFGFLLVLTQESDLRKLYTSIKNVIHDALSQDLAVTVDLSVIQHSWNAAFKRLTEENDLFLEEVYAHKVEKEKLEKMLLDKEVAI